MSKPGLAPFQYASELEQFSRSFNESLGAYQDKKRAEFMPAENAQAYRHGTRWRNGASDRPDQVSEMQSHEHELTIKFEDIVGHNLHVMGKLFIQLGDAIHSSVMQMMYKTVSEAAESVGNAVSLKESGSHAKAFAETLRRIEFGVDRSGKPTLPQFHASPQLVDAFLADLRAQGPEFEQEVREIIEEKTTAAFKRENERRAKFVVAS